MVSFSERIVQGGTGPTRSRIVQAARVLLLLVLTTVSTQKFGAFPRIGVGDQNRRDGLWTGPLVLPPNLVHTL